MDEQLRDRLIMVCITIAAVSLILAISSGIAAQKNKAKFQKEMISRMDIEEKLENSRFVVSALEEELKKLQGQTNTDQEAQKKVADELEQERLVNKALKEELIKTNNLNNSLENSLKDALSNKTGQ